MEDESWKGKKNFNCKLKKKKKKGIVCPFGLLIFKNTVRKCRSNFRIDKMGKQFHKEQRPDGKWSCNIKRYQYVARNLYVNLINKKKIKRGN